VPPARARSPGYGRFGWRRLQLRRERRQLLNVLAVALAVVYLAWWVSEWLVW
jgi:hypothetical protein